MEVIMDFVKDINVCYLVLNLLLLIDLWFYLKAQKSTRKIMVILLMVAVIGSVLMFNYGASLVDSIFSLKYLSVKIYLLSVIVTNIITLYSINRELELGYGVLNYTLFILKMIIFGSIVAVILGNKFEQLYIMDISNAVTLIDLSLVIFILYLILFSITYIGYQVFASPKVVLFNDDVEEMSIFNKVYLLVRKSCEKILIMFRPKSKEKTINNSDENTDMEKVSVLTPEELLGYEDKSHFYINGVDCSIIFQDSNMDNIVKNYYILSNDIDAVMVNGYTLEENKILRNICMKLQVGSLNHIDIESSSILNRISVEEYNFLKKIMSVQ